MKERRLWPMRVTVAVAAGFALTACLPASPKGATDSNESQPLITSTLTPDQIVSGLEIRVDSLEKQLTVKEKQVNDISTVAQEFISPGYFEGSTINLSDFYVSSITDPVSLPRETSRVTATLAFAREGRSQPFLVDNRYNENGTLLQSSLTTYERGAYTLNFLPSRIPDREEFTVDSPLRDLSDLASAVFNLPRPLNPDNPEWMRWEDTRWFQAFPGIWTRSFRAEVPVPADSRSFMVSAGVVGYGPMGIPDRPFAELQVTYNQPRS